MSSMLSEEFYKWNKLKELRLNTIIRTIDGTEYLFIELKQKNFIALKDGVTHEIPVVEFASIVSYPNSSFEQEYKSLETGDLFYIYDRGDSPLYIFERLDKRGKIVAINPVSRIKARIEPVSYAGRVKDIHPEDYFNRHSV